MTTQPEPAGADDAPETTEQPESRPSRAERRRGAADGNEPPPWQGGKGRGPRASNIAAPRHYNRHR